MCNKPCISPLALLFLSSQASDPSAGTGTEQAFKRQGNDKPGFLVSQEEPFPPSAAVQHLRATSRWPGQSRRGSDSSFLLHPLRFFQFPKGLSTCNIHLPSGVSALVSGAHLPSGAHLSRCRPPSALSRGPGVGGSCQAYLPPHPGSAPA